MRKKLLGIFLLATTLPVFAQVPPIEEMRKSQDSRKKYIDPSAPTRSNLKLSESALSYVNPFIGTGGHGHTYPGATAPFGMVQLSPDTRYNGWDGCSGYHYSDSVIYGFSHTHLSGTGIEDYCDLLLVPQTGKVKTMPGYLDKNGYGYLFSHSDEKASPGYYEVNLKSAGIQVKLTATTHAGFHQYVFASKKGKKYILIDLDHRDKLLDYSLAILDNQTISGKRISKGWAQNQHFYFYMQTNIPFEKSKLITKNGQHKLLLTFPEDANTIFVKTGISAVDSEGAKKNLEREIPEWNFIQTQTKTAKEWRNELDKINFYSPDQTVMTNFYTAIYHSYLNPNVFSDVDGRYRGRDNQIHQLNDLSDMQYTVFSIWDTYRATHPLFTLTQQARTSAFIRTFLRQYTEGGDLPVWELAGNETECMIGFHSVSIIADAFIKGLQNYDTKLAMEAMHKTAMLDEFGKKQFNENGFIGAADEAESVSRNLEYAYDHFCIAQYARKFGNNEYADFHQTNSFNFINSFDPETGFMRARRGAVWYSPFDPAEVNFNYTEANSWQYSFYAPHAVGVLSNLLGGKNALEQKLDALFSASSKLEGRDQVDISGLIGQYAHGNEPSHHIAYLYNYTNAPEKTQLYCDSILHSLYLPHPDGLSGNEDCGQMSSWYVLSALGLYQIAPGNPYFDFGRPLMDNASIQLENGKTFVFIAENNSRENKYIQEIYLNDRPYKKRFISYSDLSKGGKLVFKMGNKPSESYRTYEQTPTIAEISPDFIPAPSITNLNVSFPERDTLQLEIRHLNDQAGYTAVYNINNGPFELFNQHVEIDTTCTFGIQTIKTTRDGQTYKGPVLYNTFTKRDTSAHLKLESDFVNQYSAGGKDALLDGIRGTTDFRTGDWQGYYNQDIVAEITFDQPKTIQEAGISVLQDVRAWILFPAEVIVEYSTDGMNYTLKKATENEKLTPQSPAKATEELLVEQKVEHVLKLRITVKNYGKCPEWNNGAGNASWLFADELIIR